MSPITQAEAKRRVLAGGVFEPADDFVFTSKRERVNVNCVKAGHAAEVSWDTARNANDRGACSECRDMSKADRLREFLRHEQPKGQRIELLSKSYSEGTFAHVSVRHDDPTCGHEWTASPANLYAGWGCPECKKRDFVARRAVPNFSRESLSIALHDFGARLSEGATFGSNTSHSVSLECLKCGYGSDPRDLWSTPPKHVLNGIGCPCCAGLATTYEEFVRTLEESGAAIGPDFEKTPSHKSMKGVYCASCGLPCTSAYANVRSGNSTVCLTCQDPEGHRKASYHKWPLAHLVAQPGARSHIAGVYVKRVKPRAARSGSDDVSWTKVGYGTHSRSLVGGPRISVQRLFYAPLPAPVAAAIERECHRRCRRYTVEDADERGIPTELGITEFVKDPDLAIEIAAARTQEWGDTNVNDIQALQAFIDECEGNSNWRGGLDLTAPKPWVAR